MPLAASLILACLALSQPGTTELLQNGDLSRGNLSWDGGASFVTRRSGGPGGSPSVRVTVANPSPAMAWNVSFRQPMTRSLAKGTEVSLSFWARSTTSQPILAMIEQNSDPWTKVWTAPFTLSPEWKQYRATLPLADAVTEGRYNLTFHCAQKAGVLEFARFSLAGEALPEPPKATLEKPFVMIRDGQFSSPDLQAWNTGDRGDLKFSIQDDATKGKFARLSFATPPTQNSWETQFAQVVIPPVRRADTLYLELALRSPDKIKCWVVYEVNGEPYTKSLMSIIEPTKEWKEHKLAFKAATSMGERGSQFKIFVGGQTGQLDVANVRLTNFGAGVPLSRFPSTSAVYDTNANAEWKKQAAERIEKLRKGPGRITVVDSRGRPLRASNIRVEQTGHHFRFGTAVTASWISGDSDDSAQYRKFLKQGFNTIVFGNDFKWPNMEQQNWDETMRAVKWFQDNGIAIRGHNLVWGSYRYLPGDIQNATKEQAIYRIENRIKTASQQTKGLVYIWDVVNEAVTETELWDKVGWDQFARSFKLAREAMPGVQLAYNDFNISNENPAGARHRQTAIQRAKLIQAAGPYLDIFGDQAHMNSPATPIPTVLKAWDEVYAALKVPMEITELDLTAWDDEAHGHYIRDYVTAAFSYPAMQSVIFWGIWERDHWLAEQGGHMVNADWSPRPAWTEYLKLVNQTWRTNASLKTNAQGAASFRGFYGAYRVTATVNGKKVSGTYTLAPGGGPARVTLR